LLGQLGANGDCLYATTIARQIKHDDPDCHLTWAIGSMCRHVLDGNPHVDDIWEVPLSSRKDLASVWREFERAARRRHEAKDFDEIFLSQIYPNNLKNFDGTVRASIFRGYPGAITVPVAPVIELSQDEVAAAAEFARHHRLRESANVILFECAALSGQSFVTVDYALDVASRLLGRVDNARVILSSTSPLDAPPENVVDGSALTFRANAAITRYCTLLVGCSSGITWLCTSEAAAQVPMIQLLTRRASIYGAVVHDLDYWGVPSGHIIEMRDSPVDRAAACIAAVLTEGVASARGRFHEPLKPEFRHYSAMMMPLLRRGHLRTVAQSLRHTVARYGVSSTLVVAFAKELVLSLRHRPATSRG
jgi:hypothetical protein